MKFPTLALLAAAALTAGSCTKRPVRPQFTVVSTDSLISGNGFSCDFEYRFASIANAQDSPALAAIERMNIDRFFDLENFEGTPEEAASAAIRQVTSDMTPPGNTPESTVRPAWEGEITECYNYSRAGGYEITTADLFTETQLERLNRLIREDIYEQYGVRSDEELETKGFFPEYIGVTENFLVTPEGITFYYNPYDIGCYALGSVEVSVSREQLAGL